MSLVESMHVCMLSHFSCVQLFATLWSVALCPWDFPGKNTEVGCHFLLLGIFLTQESNLCLMFPALAGGFFTTSTSWEAHSGKHVFLYKSTHISESEEGTVFFLPKIKSREVNVG